MSISRLLSSILASVLILVVMAQGALAAASRWESTDGGRLRLIVEDPQPSRDVLRAALQIDLEPGWKTYWREPGSAGIPPSITFSGDMVRDATLHFPAPVWVDDPYGSWAGYTDPVVLPVSLEINPDRGSGIVEADVFLGICRDVCIPVSATLELAVGTARSSALHGAIVSTAYSALPHAGNERLSVESGRLLVNGELEIVISHPDGGAGDVSLFVAAGPDRPYAKPRAVSRTDASTTFHVRPARAMKDGGAFDITVTARLGGDAVETVLSIAAP
ncbi:protein-disulfide reductase DsbD domain-containing protein [Oricola sp.]|uniref:protein-disulfide reductase DsbD domain-containing protein n=1 Tax=Oricola sp. TaxID=1979950 RepID=UPI003BAD547E